MDKLFENINKVKTLSSLEEMRKSFESAYNERKEVLTLCERADSLSHKSFGYIKDAFESLSPHLFESKDGKKIIAKYTKIIRENDSLSNFHVLLENIRKAHSGFDVDYFIDNISNVDWNVNGKELNEGLKNVGKVLSEAYITLGKECEKYLPEDNTLLYNSLSYIAENKKTPKNIVEYSDAVKIIRENIIKNENGESVFAEKDLDSIADQMIREFNEKYEGKLSAEEYELISEISKHSNNETLFENYKNECLKLLESAKDKYNTEGDTESSKRLTNVYEQVSKKDYNSESVVSDIANLIEISHVFE